MYSLSCGGNYYIRKNLSTQSAAGAASTAAIPTVVNLKQTSMQGDLNSSINDRGSSDDAAGAKGHLVTGSLVPSSGKHHQYRTRRNWQLSLV
jgi:hypothetical protein